MNKVPFYGNTDDGIHCLQASIKIILKYFLPDEDFGWERLEDMTKFVKSKGTWATSALLSLNDMGFDVVEINTFNIDEFIYNSESYLIQRYSQEAGEYAIKNSDLEQEKITYKELRKRKLQILKIPELTDVEKYLKEGYLLMAAINSKILNNKQGFVGHYVVIFDYQEDNLTIHDPGLPPLENRVVSHELFDKAWSIGSKENRLLYAFKLNK